MSNQLADELSPYLLQHADNPVDWHPWDAAALEQSRVAEEPIFLSIGYSACHWCHVMAHESFEDPEIARLLNENFISIKVDREERPELDQLYMEAVQVMGGRGGWPLSVFLTPSLEPFFGGTYWPSHSRAGMPGFDQILQAVGDAWKHRREGVLQQAHQVADFLRKNQFTNDDGTAVELNEEPLRSAEQALRRTFDPTFGGFGDAPKFPQPIALTLLLRRWQKTRREDLLEIVTTTLDRMAAGGIYDHLGGGFHRYSVDDRWLVPHFEKMLYDNALLAGCYLDAWQATGTAAYERVVRETLDYVLRDMTDPKGGFYASEDADSEGEEGKFYLWTPGEVEDVLGREAAKTFCRVYDVTEPGNFEGRNILNLSRPVETYAAILGRDPAGLLAELTESRGKLLAARAKRLRPGRDDKVLVNWNGLMIDAMARAAAALGEPRYGNAAVAASEFLLTNVRHEDGRLLHCWRAGRAKGNGYLDDYAGLANAIITLYETRFPGHWRVDAIRLAEDIIEHFADAEHGGFFYTAADHEFLIVRQKDVLDNPVPSGTALTATVLLRLGRLCDRADFFSAAEKTLRGCNELMRQAPTATGQLLLGLHTYLER